MQNLYAELGFLGESHEHRMLNRNWILEEQVVIFLVHFVIFKFPFKTKLALLLSFNIHLLWE